MNRSFTTQHGVGAYMTCVPPCLSKDNKQAVGESYSAMQIQVKCAAKVLTWSLLGVDLANFLLDRDGMIGSAKGRPRRRR